MGAWSLPVLLLLLVLRPARAEKAAGNVSASEPRSPLPPPPMSRLGAPPAAAAAHGERGCLCVLRYLTSSTKPKYKLFPAKLICNPDEQSILPCKKEELQCGNGLCLLNWLRCHYKKDCGRDYMSIKLTCSKVHSNQSSPINEFPGYSENSNDTSLLVSPLLVAGVVIGLVLFLSCVTIIIGSLRKDGRLRHPHLRRNANYAPDGFSYGDSIGELRSTCTEEFPPAFDFGSYMETLSQVNVMYPDSPPRYDECIGPGATQIYIPTDDPPPYSLTDPCQRNELSTNIRLEEEAASGTTGRCSNYPVRLQDLQQPISSISLTALTLEAAPPYETVVCEQNSPIPLIPMDVLKNSSTDCQTLPNQII